MRTTFIAFLALLCVSAAASAQSELTLRIGPMADLSFGETSYDLQFLIEPNWHGASELIFPLDIAAAGIEAEGTWKRDGVTRLTFAAKFATAVSAPGNPMTDRDWDIYFGQISQDFSYTESDMDASAFNLEAEIAAVMARNDCMDLSLVVGVGYQKVSQTAQNLSGTQVYYTDSSMVFYDVSYTGEALKYDISWLTPRVGLMPRLYFGPQATFTCKMAVTPVRISDTDDHVLRNFETNSSGWGWGGLGHAEFVYQFRSETSSRAPYVKFFGHLAHYGADLEETRYWYGDDPITDGEDDTGLSYSGLQHNIRTTRYGFGLGLGITF